MRIMLGEGVDWQVAQVESAVSPARWQLFSGLLRFVQGFFEQSVAECRINGNTPAAPPSCL
jgi:hypothetical protein